MIHFNRQHFKPNSKSTKSCRAYKGINVKNKSLDTIMAKNRAIISFFLLLLNNLIIFIKKVFYFTGTVTYLYFSLIIEFLFNI